MPGNEGVFIVKKNVLIGRVLTGIKIASDKEAICFDTDGGEVVAKCDADCCSHTWVEHIELPALGFPATVVSVTWLDMPGDGSEECENGELKFYGLKITTDRGDIVIDYRNSSNGYYGGSLSWPDEYHYGGVYGQNDPSLEWVDVTSDL